MNFLKVALYPFLTLFYKLLLIFPKHEKPTKHDICICGIFKNEGLYLKEWIEYHTLIGIDHFYLYNNFSTDNYQEILKPYIEKGLVTLTEWPVPQGQMSAYKDCLSRFSSETHWIGFIDLDEFVNPVSYSSIKECLKEYNRYGSVMLSWKTFGTSNLKERDVTKPVIQAFTAATPDFYLGKCFYNTLFPCNPDNKHNQCFHHVFYYSIGPFVVPPVNVKRQFFISPVGHTLNAKNDYAFYLNHYYTKSEKEFLAKISNGDVFYTVQTHKIEQIKKIDDQCITVNTSIQKYLPDLLKLLEK